MPKLRITLVKSVVGHKQDQRDTVKALGLRRISMTTEKEENQTIRGMVHKVRHLVRVERI